MTYRIAGNFGEELIWQISSLKWTTKLRFANIFPTYCVLTFDLYVHVYKFYVHVVILLLAQSAFGTHANNMTTWRATLLIV